MPWVRDEPEEKLPSVMGTGREAGEWVKDEGPAIYEAQDSPGTGGYGLVNAPAGVPAMPPDMPPSPFAGVLPGGAVPPPTAVPPQLAPRVPLGGGPSVELPIGPPGQAQAAAALEPTPQQAAGSIMGWLPDVGTPGRVGAALGRMWSKTERGGKYDALGHAFVNHGLNSLLQVPSFAENLEDTGKAGAVWLAETMGMATPEGIKAIEGAPSILGSVRRGYRKLGLGGPERAEDVRAAPELFPGGQSFEDSRREQLARTQGLEATQPGATTLGEIGATVGEVVGLKRATGVSKLMKTRELRLVDELKASKEQLATRGRPKGMEWVKQKVTSPGYYKMAQGAGRIGETTVEGALTAALNNGDPLEMAALAGLGQGIASPIMYLGSLKGGGGRLRTAMAKAAVAGTALTVWELLPGGQEKSTMQALDSGFDKVKLGIAGNIFLGLLGMGRVRTQDWAQVNRFTDDINNVPRAATLATVERFAGADDRAKNKIKRVLRTMASRPDSIKPHTLDLLSNGLSRGGDDFLKTIEKLEAEGEL